ncbi:DUF4214 domain-containing protein [Aquirhabdus parva]|uniref:DUF4214 domain-containing protein n=1 Tax=Aquirhabdus parva TaxID=2283318 RepID=A0A345P3V9_9GAMM|nr:DUF4214 domain-containing protein [Aquirhabdus parva]AXI01968.1 DUF4214 domain-containing protein [Aquirhabdus parva]
MPNEISINDRSKHISGNIGDIKALMKYDDQEFIENAYGVLLNRYPDSEGLRYYLGRLRSGVPKARILHQLHTSSEAREIGVKLPGLKAELIASRILRLPVLGVIHRNLLSNNRVYRSYATVNADVITAVEHRLNGIVHRFLVSGGQEDSRFDKSIEVFKQLIEQQGQLIEQQGQLIAQQGQLVATIAAQKHTGNERVELTSVEGVSQNIPDEPPKVTNILSSRASGIFKQLKTKSTSHFEGDR